MNQENTPSPFPQPEQPEPVSNQAQPYLAPEPPKKKKKTALIIIVSAFLVLAVAAGIFAALQSQRATSVAKTYVADVRKHTTTIVSTDTTPKERAELIDEPVQLEDVYLGKELSGEYRDAVELKGRYDTLVRESAFTLKELFTFLDLSSDDSDFISSIGEIALTPAPGFSVTTNKADSLAGSESFITVVEEKSSRYAKLADRAKKYTFPSELDESKQAVVDGLTRLSQNEAEKAKIQKEYNEKIKADGFNAEEGQATLSKMNQVISMGVKEYGDLRDAVQLLVKNYIDGGVAERIVKTSNKVNDDFDAFVESVKE